MFGDERYDEVDAEGMEILEAWQKLDPESRDQFKRQLMYRAHSAF